MERIKLTKFRIKNFRCIDDSEWITIDNITALVGINESGKTTILNGLHTLNPSNKKINVDYVNDYPRDRVSKDRMDIKEKLIVEGLFLIPEDYLLNRGLVKEFSLSSDEDLYLSLSRNYDKTLHYNFKPSLDDLINLETLNNALDSTRSSINRKVIEGEFTEAVKKDIIKKLDVIEEKINEYDEIKVDLNQKERNELVTFLNTNNQSIGGYFKLAEQELETLLNIFDGLIKELKKEKKTTQLFNKIEKDIPVFIYFEDYNIVEGHIDIFKLVRATDSNLEFNEFKIQRTLFKHVGIDPKEIYNLGNIDKPDREITSDEQKKLKERQILLESAGQIMTKTLNEHFKEDKEYKVKYNIDHNLLQILISDLQNPYGINLEERSKGFRWFFSFFLVFLVESRDSLKNTILLLDEPGIHLHLRAQAHLIEFFEKLKTTNQIIYTTHSPFLIDDNHLERVRAIYRDKGRTKVTENIIEIDEKSIFPLQAALSYKTSQVIYQGSRILLVEGIIDYNYIKTINAILLNLKRETLEDIVIIPCQGASKVDFYARFVMDLKNIPVVLLDSDKAGRAAYKKLSKSLFLENEKKIIRVSDFVNKKNAETEDIIGKEILLKILNDIQLTSEIIKDTYLNDEESFIEGLRSICKKNNIELKDNWKNLLSLEFKKTFLECEVDLIKNEIPEEIIDRFEILIKQINTASRY